MDLEKREELLMLFEKYQGLLSQSQKQVIHLRYVEDLSLSEIADILAVSRQAVNDSVKKGEKKLLRIKEKMEV